MVAYGKVMEAVKRKVSELLSFDEYSDGIRMSDFASKYTHHMGRPLSYHDLGFSTLHEFITAIPDVARIKPSEADPNCMVVAMAGMRKLPRKANSGLQSLSRQELSKSNKRIPFEPEVEGLEADRYGRYSVCIPVENISSSVTNDDIKEEFSLAGDVADVHRTDKFIFVRFFNKEELQNCLHMFRSEYDLGIGRQSIKNEMSSNESQRYQNNSEQSSTRNQNMSHRVPHSEGPAGDADRRRGGDRFRNQFSGDADRYRGDDSYSNHSAENSDKHKGGDRSRNQLGNDRDRPRVDNRYNHHSNGDTDRQRDDRYGANVDRFRGGDRINNHQMNSSPNSRKSQASGSYNDNEDEEASSTELFAANIESKEEFEQALQKYRPKHMNVVVKDHTKFAFVSMWNHEDALAVIRNMDQKMQTTRRLTIRFDTKKQRSQSEHSSSLSDSCNDVGDMPTRRAQNNSSGTRPKMKTPLQNGLLERPMPGLESSVDYSGMPHLVPNADIVDPDGLYDVDTSVLVTNFPPRTMESQLRAVFKGYRVMDICVLNNGYTNECTSALVYMSTIYESIKALRSEERFMMDGCPLKVIPPLENVLLKKILVRMDTGLREWN